MVEFLNFTKNQLKYYMEVLRMSKEFKYDIKHRMSTSLPDIPIYKAMPIEDIQKFESILDRKIKQLKNGNIDVEIYREYLYSIVDELVITKFAELERKHHQNMNLINGIFLRRSSDKAEIQKFIELIDVEIAKTEEEFLFVKTLYEDFNPLYKGKFKNSGLNFIDENDEIEG